MNLIFVALDNRDDPTSIGPSLKIKQQCEALEFNGINVYELIVKNKAIYIRNGEEIKKIYDFKNKSVIEGNESIFLRKLKILRRMKEIFDILIDYIKSEKIETAYVRNLLPWNYFAVKFIKKLRKIEKVVILDVPTYPYDKELSKINLILDSFYNKHLKGKIDFIVTTSDESKIYGIKAIKITNGIDVKRYKLKRKIEKEDEINLIGVANVSPWHGYDRVIRGLKEYYKDSPNVKVFFHIVGEGRGLNNLKALTKNLGLTEYVIFHGYKTGERLDEIFDISNIAIGSLGLHRIGLLKSSTLKLREYCARGIPFIFSSTDEDFEESFEFMFRVPSDESPINIKEILNFYKHIKNKNYPSLMRSYAERKLSWNNKMKKIVDELKKVLDNMN
ncbi:glycosyltransferase involved in cell wall biosynthesis [Thermosipho japonicus]|uniref:Glycosyltransferase involved in cell wall biosynthesis n=1 Tax=Thermosipho japonicus TaxID=90323 RepID=A0A841GTR6_9BACT|nr:glycosyltransferase [Thermosipho japonicus]MBB6062790.1 glycosyltransferase involved in cell wall biosynthesis [Thermosipho japonicus]